MRDFGDPRTQERRRDRLDRVDPDRRDAQLRAARAREPAGLSLPPRRPDPRLLPRQRSAAIAGLARRPLGREGARLRRCAPVRRKGAMMLTRAAGARRHRRRRPAPRRPRGADAAAASRRRSTRASAGGCWSRRNACSAPARSSSAAPTTRWRSSTRPARERGVVAYSSGNHAQGVAAAAQLLGMPAAIVMPARRAAHQGREHARPTAPRSCSTTATREDREAIAQRIAAERGAELLPPYDDARVIAGQGTVGLELAAQAAAMGARLDAVVAPCSGGGLVGGIALALAAREPRRPRSMPPSPRASTICAARSTAATRVAQRSRPRARSATRCWRRRPAF